MKVLHLINTLGAGGAELHLLRLLPHLRAARVDIVLACLRSHVADNRSLVDDFLRAEIPVIDLEADHRMDLRYLVTFPHLIKREQPDVVHTHLPRADLAGLVTSWRPGGIPWVCTVHDIHSRSWSGKWFLPLFTPIWNRADLIIAISAAVRDWLIRERHVAPDRIRVIHYGVDVEEFSAAAHHLRKQWAELQGPIVGTIGRLEQRKGHHILIRAFPEVLQRVPSARLLIAGHDPWGYGRVLERLISANELDDRVRLVGFQSDIPSFLNAIDVFALASRSEGFGQVVIEAMAAAKPVVVSGIAPLTEIVEEGVTGLLIPPGDVHAWARAMVRLLLDRQARDEMGRAGRDRVRRDFSVAAMAASTLDAYRFVRGGA